jgi:hypothetical protein
MLTWKALVYVIGVMFAPFYLIAFVLSECFISWRIILHIGHCIFGRLFLTLLDILMDGEHTNSARIVKPQWGWGKSCL